MYGSRTSSSGITQELVKNLESFALPDGVKQKLHVNKIPR